MENLVNVVERLGFLCVENSSKAATIIRGTDEGEGCLINECSKESNFMSVLPNLDD